MFLDCAAAKGLACFAPHSAVGDSWCLVRMDGVIQRSKVATLLAEWKRKECKQPRDFCCFENDGQKEQFLVHWRPGANRRFINRSSKPATENYK